MAEADFTGDIAVITGGARGLGFAVAQHLAARGAEVVLADIDETAAGAAAATLRDEGLSAHAVPMQRSCDP